MELIVQRKKTFTIKQIISESIGQEGGKKKKKKKTGYCSESVIESAAAGKRKGRTRLFEEMMCELRHKWQERTRYGKIRE